MKSSTTSQVPADTGKSGMKAAILSLSLLTVMAGAAVAPALDLIRQYFSSTPTVYVQLIISMPALFIAVTNLFFGRLTQHFRSKTLVIFALILYLVFGCGAGLFRHLVPILICRALVGVSVGIIMPLSTGLISFYYTRKEQSGLMGLSSAMNMLGGVTATILAGFLAGIGWQFSFLVYLMGLISIILCLFHLPNDSLKSSQDRSASFGQIFRQYYPFLIAVFLVMLAFFIYPADFAMEAARTHSVPAGLTAIVMASCDVFGFISGLLYGSIQRRLKINTRFLAPVCFFIGYALLSFLHNLIGTLAGSWCVGFAIGIGIPFLMSAVSMRAGRNAASTIMPFMSMFIYMSQFLAPFILSAFRSVLGSVISGYSSFHAAMIISLVLFVWSFTIRNPGPSDKV